MKRTNLTIILDCLLTFLGLGLVFLCCMRYYGLPLLPSVIASALLAFSFAFPFGLFLIKRRKKSYLKRRDEEEKNKLMLHLTLLSDRETLRLLSSTLPAPFTEENATVKRENKRYIPLFTMQPVSADEIVRLVKKYESENVVLWVNELTTEAKGIADKLNVEVLSGKEVYLALKQAELLPEHYRLEEKSKRTPRERAERYFAKGNSRSFFWCGVGLLFLSFFTFFPTYYVISGSILILLSLAVTWLGYRKG